MRFLAAQFGAMLPPLATGRSSKVDAATFALPVTEARRFRSGGPARLLGLNVRNNRFRHF